MKEKDKWKKKVTLSILLLSTGFFFVNLIFNYTPNFALIDDSYNEKMKNIGRPVPIFVKEHTEVNSSILLFHHGIYLLTQPILYPQRDVYFTRYGGDDDKLFKYIRKKSINYLLIFYEYGPAHLSENQEVFSTINYSSRVYLLKINWEVL